MPITKLTPENNYPYLADRLKALEQVVPEAFADGKINWDRLREVLGEDLEEGGCEEYFGLNWPGKREARQRAAIPSRGTLVPVPGEGVNEDQTENLFIEGDNLEVLKLLQKSYAGKIKMIYIDPPYNTGNDFIYNDDFTDPLEAYLKYTGARGEGGELLTTNTRADGRFHSKWLNMMYPRLLLARRLLKSDGIIVIHIDEHEYSNLQIIMNEIFGEENNLGTIIWDKRNPKGDARGVAHQHEYIIIYANNFQNFTEHNPFQMRKENAEKILEKAKELIQLYGQVSTEVRKKFKDWINRQSFSGGEKAYCLIDDDGEVYQSVSMAWPNKKKAPDDYFIPIIHPITKKECPIPLRGWRNPSSTMNELLKANLIIFGPDENIQPRRKYLLRENVYENVSSLLYYGGSDDNYFSKNQLFFDNPKPKYVSKKLIEPIMTPDGKNEILLDFFSGSCTAAHAIIELNMIHGGSRKFIMVQLPENVDFENFTTVSEIGKQRIRNVINEMYKNVTNGTVKPSKTQNLNGNYVPGFKMFKISRSNYKQWPLFDEKNIKEVETLFDGLRNPLVEDWKKEDLLAEILLLEGFPLTSKLTLQEEIYRNEVTEVSAPGFCEHRLYVCLDEALHPSTLDLLKPGKDDIFICLDSALTDELKARVQDKFNVHVI